jgi:hypothetical protein
MHQFGLLDASGTAHRAEIAGQAIPHGIAGQDLIPHPGARHGNKLGRGIIHPVSVGAGCRASATLDAQANSFPTGNSTDFIYQTTNSFSFLHQASLPPAPINCCPEQKK